MPALIFKKKVKQSKFCTIMTEKVTNISDHDWLVICIRWIHQGFEPHEDMIGFYQVEDTISETLFTSIKDSLSRMDIPLTDCGGQCYDEPSNMDGAKTGLAIHIKRIEPCALSTYCFGHTLQLAVSDSIKQQN